MRNKEEEGKKWMALFITFLIFTLLLGAGMVSFYTAYYKPLVEKEKRLRGMLEVCEAKKKELEAIAEEKAREVEKLKGAYEELMGELEARLSSGDVSISRKGDKIYVSLLERIMFDSGRAEIKEEGVKVLEKIAEIINQYEDQEVIVEGHTDDTPIGPSLQKIYPTNWDLSAKRAVNVVRYLEYLGVNPSRLSAVAYGEHRPVADNSTEEGRALNRRIEIVLMPVKIEKQE